MSTWTKRSEREPVKDDMPVMAGAYVIGSTKKWDERVHHESESLPCWTTHWRSVKCEPPPRELTQREEDEAMAVELVEENPGINRVGVALKAIHTERREVAKLMALYTGEFWGTHDYSSSELRTLRARLDEQGNNK
jgi:hypothetical protein